MVTAPRILQPMPKTTRRPPMLKHLSNRAADVDLTNDLGAFIIEQYQDGDSFEAIRDRVVLALPGEYVPTAATFRNWHHALAAEVAVA